MTSHTNHIFEDLLPNNLRRFKVLFERFQRELDGALERATKEYSLHMPSKGDVCEASVRRYLKDTLGSRYSVTHGFIFDYSGRQSRQQDTIIFDDHWSIRFKPKDSDEPAIIPVESVYATIEVKKTLSASDLRDAIDNIRSFRSLERERIGPEFVTSNKKIANLGHLGNIEYQNPYFSVIFAFSAGRTLDSVVRQLKNDVSTIPAQEWPDVVVIHNEGVILPFCETCRESATNIYSITRDGHTPTYHLDKLDGAFSTLGFHLLLMTHIHRIILAPLNFEVMYKNLATVSRWLASHDQMESSG